MDQPPIFLFTATVEYKGVTEFFYVSGYSEEWCKTRAASHFIYALHPELNIAPDSATFKRSAKIHIEDGLKISLQ